MFQLDAANLPLLYELAESIFGVARCNLPNPQQSSTSCTRAFLILLTVEIRFQGPIQLLDLYINLMEHILHIPIIISYANYTNTHESLRDQL